MEKFIHGGDRYRNNIQMDFSVNINPLGVPEGIKNSFEDLIEGMEYYPDMDVISLKEKLSEKLCISKEYLLFGNGASELMMAVMHAYTPKKIVVPVPSFIGYERAACAVDLKIDFYEMNSCFEIDEDILNRLDEDVDLLILANPNNPTGKLIDASLLDRILKKCRDENILVLLDECFIKLSDNGDEHSLISKFLDFPNLLLLRAFTKTYAIPGVRLGYLVCSDLDKISRIEKHIPEWNVSTIAQSIGIKVLEDNDYINESLKVIRNEREYLEGELANLGLNYIKSSTNFLMFKSDKINFYQELLKLGILIRDCGNYRGIDRGFYRIAIKKHDENVKLIEAMKTILNKNEE